MAPRLTVAVLLLTLCTACATTHVVQFDTGQGELREYRLPTSNRSIRVNADTFEEALTRLVLNAPLPLRTSEQGLLVRASYPSDGTDTRWQRIMSKSLGGICKPDQHGDDCLSLSDDVMSLGEWDKLEVALSLSLRPMKESISRAVEDTLAPQLFYTVIATGLITWVVLAANPEPVFTKAAALISAIFLIYLGVETFLEVVDASRELKRATDRAITPQELNQAGQRFANRVGPEVARVAVLAVMMVVGQGMTGGAAGLASRLSTMPGLTEAAAAGASRLGINLANVGQVSAITVAGSTLVISLPATAVAMVAQGQGKGQIASTVSGQLHHVISKRIARSLEEHATLRGHYTERDPRFVTRATDKASHNGYQKWHRDVDDEVIDWLKRTDKATPEEFEMFLRQLYNRPEMRARFPNGF